MSNLPYAMGLMSGTSTDGVDAALLRTDGDKVESTSHHCFIPYCSAFQAQLQSAMRGQKIEGLEERLHDYHVTAVRVLLDKAQLDPNDIGVIGFHGHTLLHNPTDKRTIQIGDGAKLAKAVSIPVVYQLRYNDVAQGGQGAPLVPIYHRALLEEKVSLPVAVVNIGGVANVTFMGEEDQLQAFDTGPGNGLINDVMKQYWDLPYDNEGEVARKGQVNISLVEHWLCDPYFAKNPPKSLDRNSFSCDGLSTLAPEDQVATLLAFTVRSIALASTYFSAQVAQWIITGGGRHNCYLMEQLDTVLKGQVQPIEVFGVNGDMIEAEAFAYLAMRSLKNLPITFPGTTGVNRPLSGGVVCPIY